MEWGLVIIIRLVVPLLILRWNLSGAILAIIADNLDVVILDFLGVTEFAPYNQVDKFLDTYFYLIAGYTMFSWPKRRGSAWGEKSSSTNKFARNVGIFLLGYRLLGVIIYEITNLRAVLFIFPNVFIFYFMYYLIYMKIFKKEPFTNLKNALPALVILTLLKLGHEYILHVAQFPIYEWIRTNILRVFVDTL